MTDPDYDDVDDRGPRFPTPVKVAGIIWIVYGVLQLIGLVANLALAAQAAAGGAKPGSGGGVCGGIIGIAFLVVGLQTFRGTAKDVMGNSIGSIIFSLLYFAIAAILIGGGALVGQLQNGPAGKGAPPPPVNNQELQVLMLVGGIFVAFLGLMLLLAGILALSNRAKYREWREANFPTERRRRRRRDDDYEEEDDRRRDDGDAANRR